MYVFVCLFDLFIYQFIICNGPKPFKETKQQLTTKNNQKY